MVNHSMIMMESSCIWISFLLIRTRKWDDAASAWKITKSHWSNRTIRYKINIQFHGKYVFDFVTKIRLHPVPNLIYYLVKFVAFLVQYKCSGMLTKEVKCDIEISQFCKINPFFFTITLQRNAYYIWRIYSSSLDSDNIKPKLTGWITLCIVCVLTILHQFL